MYKKIPCAKADEVIPIIRSPFPVLENSKHMPTTYLVYLGNSTFSEVTVWQCKLELKGFTPFSGIVTSPSSVKFKGFGQHGYIKESNIVSSAAKAYCEDHNLVFCKAYCTWPTLVAAVNH